VAEDLDPVSAGTVIPPPRLLLVAGGRRRPLRAWGRPFLAWCAMARELSPATVLTYGDGLESFFAFSDSHALEYPDQVTPAAVEAFMATLRHGQGLSVATANHRRHVLIGFFRYLEREEVVKSNPAKLAYGLRKPKRLPDFLNPSEQIRLLEFLVVNRTAAGIRDLAIVATGLLAGLRAAELCTLRRSDLELERGTARVEQGKGKRDRFVPVIPWLADVLRRYLAVSRPVFMRDGRHDGLFVSHQGRPFTSRGLYHLIRRVASPVVGRRVHPHMLRHSFASRSLAGGASLPALQKALGHSKLETTGIYLHLPDKAYVTEFTAALTGESPAPREPEPALPVVADGPPARRPPPPSHPFADRARRAQLRDVRLSRVNARPRTRQRTDRE
jgi:site-specific recombinase XerD